MKTKNFTADELATLVENFAKQMSEYTHQDEEGTAIVISMVTPSEDGHTRSVTCVAGRGDNLMKCMHNLNDQDAKLIDKYVELMNEFNTAKLKKIAHDLLGKIKEDLEKMDAEDKDEQTADADNSEQTGE